MSSPAASPVSSPPNSTAPPPVTPSPPPPISTAPPPVTPSPPPLPSPSPPPPSSPPPSGPTTPPSGSPSPPPPSSTPPPPSSTPPTTPSTPPPPRSPPPPSSTPPTTPSSPAPPTPTTSKNPPPPPQSPSFISPPPPSSSPPQSKSFPVSAVVGIAIGGVLILLVLGVLYFCFTKKRRRNEHGGDPYYVPPPPPRPAPAPGPKDDYYGGGPGQHWQQSNPTPSDQYMMPLNPPPAAGGRPPSNRPPTPPHQQPLMSYSGGSGSNYSGSDGQLPPPSPALGFSKNTFTYEELAVATDGFSDANILGQGGFGYVHKGVLPNGKEVAVKALKAGSGQGEREFQAEVEIISRVHHRHLVSLVGYCMTGSDRMLVYEFVPNNNLHFHLHGKGQPTMNWSTRLKLAIGSAKGLAYLHEDCHPKIIHRDIKAANILIDSKFEAKVADFGLAKFSPDLDTHISTRVMGTFGYLAPEYAASGKLTDKSDVFSFGVVLLELITGRLPVNTTQTYMDDSLVDWARPLLNRASEDENFDSLADPRLEKSYKLNEMARMVTCAAACVRHSARRRPRLSQVVRVLEGDVSLSDLNDGIKPGQSAVYGSYGSSDYDSSQYREDMKQFRQTTNPSKEQGSSEYGGTTSEYGLYPSGTSSEGQTTREMEMGRFSGLGSTGHTTEELDSDMFKRKGR